MYAPWGNDFAFYSLMYPKLPEQCLTLIHLFLNEWIAMADQSSYEEAKAVIYSMVVP